MYNYGKNGVALDGNMMAIVEKFNEVARTLATESVENTALKHDLNDTLDGVIADESITAEEREAQVKAIKAQIDALDEAWTARRKVLEIALYGGKDEDGKKINGICSIVSDDLYKAYVKFVSEGASGEYRDLMKNFVLLLVTEDYIKDGAFNHFYNDIVQTMSSVRYNSNSQIAQGAAFITTINKRNYKKMLLGAIHDIYSNNRTLKIKKSKKSDDNTTTTK